MAEWEEKQGEIKNLRDRELRAALSDQVKLQAFLTLQMGASLSFDKMPIGALFPPAQAGLLALC